MATVPNAKFSEEEYLRLERAAEYKSEYHDGEMFAMSGGSAIHARLSASIIAMLHRQMPAGCCVYSSDLRITIPATRTYTYPDCSVVCGDSQLLDDDNLLNPVLIAEVLSPSTEGYDRGKKFELYRTIESFREYLIVHQDRHHVEHYSKQDDASWILREHIGADASVAIARLNARIPLIELYASAIDIS